MTKKLSILLLGLLLSLSMVAEVSKFDNFPSQNYLIASGNDVTDTFLIQDVLVYPSDMLTKNRSYKFKAIEFALPHYCGPGACILCYDGNNEFSMGFNQFYSMGNTLRPLFTFEHRILKDNRIQLIATSNTFIHANLRIYLTLNPPNEQQRNMEVQYQQFRQSLFNFAEELADWTETVEEIDYNLSTIHLIYKRFDHQTQGYDTEILKIYSKLKGKGFTLKERSQTDTGLPLFILTHPQLNGELHFFYNAKDTLFERVGLDITLHFN